MEKRRLSRLLFLNERTDPLSWTPEHMNRMIKELAEFRPEVLEASPALLAKLCRYILAFKKTVHQPKLIIFTYEYPTRFNYQQILRVFDAPTASSYGSNETGYVFMQCEEGRFHQNTDFCRVDFQPLKHEHGGPFLGRILITTFNNPWYYLVRFDIGDLVRIDKRGSCPCGRDWGLILSSIEGRTKNVTLTCGGRLVTLRELDDALCVLEGVDEYQLRQIARDVYHLHLVSKRTDRKNLSEEAGEILHGLYGGEAKVSVIFEKAIAAEASGKYCISGAIFPMEIDDYLDERHASIQEANGPPTSSP